MSTLVLRLIFLFSYSNVYHDLASNFCCFYTKLTWLWKTILISEEWSRRNASWIKHLVGKIEKKLQRFASCSTCYFYHDWDSFSKERNRSLSTYINVNRPKKTYSCIGEAFMAKNISINRRNMKIKYPLHNMTDQDLFLGRGLCVSPIHMDEWAIKTPNPICRLFFQLTC